MRIQSRVALAGSVVAMFVASSGVALLMPERAEGVAVPEFAASTEVQAAPPAEAAPPPEAAPPAEAAGPVIQPISGEQIAALALAPAQDRAATIIAERARAEAAAKEAAGDDDEDSSGRSNSDKWQELRDRIREACDDGRIRGPICG